MKPPPFTLTNDSITVVWGGKPHTVQKGSPHFPGLRTAIISEDWEAIPNHLTVAKSLKEWAKGAFEYNGSRFSYKGEQLPTDINERIISMASRGEDPTPLFKFYERLEKNPSYRSVEQLYPFLKHQGIPFTKDGCFYAYKGVRRDFKDQHSGTVDNRPGVVNQMPRNKISDDPNEACHEGFHVGALSYAKGFSHQVVICKVDPADVVCIPYDSSQEKMRVCKYKVVGNWNGQELPDTVFIDDDEHNDVDKVEGVPAPFKTKLNDEEKALADAGNKIEAIKAYRTRKHCGLLEAKNEVDAYQKHKMEGLEKTIENIGAMKAEEKESDSEDANYDPENDFLAEPCEECGAKVPQEQVDSEGHWHSPTCKYYAPDVEKDLKENFNVAAAEADEKDAKKGAKEHHPVKRAATKGFKKFNNMNMKELMELSIEDLRQYAGKGLEITGASKIPGGKTALVSRILEVRKRASTKGD